MNNLLNYQEHKDDNRQRELPESHSFLLRGKDLKEAKQWLKIADGKKPEPTPLHRQYIQASQELHQIDLARELASKADEIRVHRRSDLIELSVLLAVEAIRRFPCLESNQALRQGLALLLYPKSLLVPRRPSAFHCSQSRWKYSCYCQW